MTDTDPADALPAEFAALLAQLTGIQAEPATAPLLEAAHKDSGLADAAPSESALDGIAQLIQNAQGKVADDKVDRSELTEEPPQPSDTSLLLSAALAAASTQQQARSVTSKVSIDDSRRTSTTTSPLQSPDTAGKQSADNFLLARTIDLSSSPAQSIALRAANPASASEVLAGQTATANIAVDSATLPGSNGFANALSSAQGTQAQAQTSPPQANDIPTPLHDRQWGQNFSEKIVWLAKSDQQIAQININPPQLGPIQINLNLSGDQASAIFTSPHAEVRQAIEDAMPRLREMLNGAGINLGQANVGAQLPQQNRETPPQFANGTRFSGETAILPGDSTAASSAVAVQRGRGLVDLFA